MARRASRDVKQYKSDIKKLRRLGLYNPKSDAVTSYGKKQTKKYADVLSGRSSVVKTTDIVARRYHREGFRTHGNKVVIPQSPDKLPRYNKSTRKITVRTRHGGEFVRSEIVPIRAGSSVSDLRKVDTSKYYLSLPLQRFGNKRIDYMNYEDADELINDITMYARKPDLLSYVILVPREGRVPGSTGSSRKFPNAQRGSPRVGE